MICRLAVHTNVYAVYNQTLQPAYCRTSRLRDCVFDSRSKIPRSGDFSRILESTLGPVLRLISDLELTLGRRLRQSAALVPAEPSLLT